MNITETFQVYAHEPNDGDGRWVFVDASSAEVLVNVNGRSCPGDVNDLRRLRAIINHFIEAEEVTETSTLAAIAAEFEE